ncbi:MAG: hypothetical protein ABXS91_10625 [Sulfurimonas sp.]
MKKLAGFLSAAVAVFALSGCGGGGSDDGPIPETYFITDSYGYGVADIIYHCDSGLSGITNFEGAFTFDLRGDNCNFDFVTNNIVDDVYIEFDNDPNTIAGADGIYFECFYDGQLDESGVTDNDGYITDASMYDGCTLFDIY